MFDRRRDGLHLYRECRGIAPLVLPAGAAGPWDGRYHVANKGGQTLVISACGDGTEGLQGPALRAHRAAPCLNSEDGGAVVAQDATIEPVVAPYADFLPRFDLPVAQALADIVGAVRFVSPPNE